MVAKTDGTGGIDAATVAHRGRWAFAALLGGNMVLAVGAPLVRLADTGPIATGFWRMAIALPFLALLGWREMGGRMPPRAEIGVDWKSGGLGKKVGCRCKLGGERAQRKKKSEVTYSKSK